MRNWEEFLVLTPSGGSAPGEEDSPRSDPDRVPGAPNPHFRSAGASAAGAELCVRGSCGLESGSELASVLLSRAGGGGDVDFVNDTGNSFEKLIESTIASCSDDDRVSFSWGGEASPIGTLLEGYSSPASAYSPESTSSCPGASKDACASHQDLLMIQTQVALSLPSPPSFIQDQQPQDTKAFQFQDLKPFTSQSIKSSITEDLPDFSPILGSTSSSSLSSLCSTGLPSSTFDPSSSPLSKSEANALDLDSASRRRRSADIGSLIYVGIYSTDDQLLSWIRIWRNHRGSKYYDCVCGKRKAVQDIGKIKKHASLHLRNSHIPQKFSTVLHKTTVS